jgi:hypothetical protein
MDAELLARMKSLADRQDILDCLNRFSRGMDRFDRELFLSAFHSDATIAAGVFVGAPAALYVWAESLHDQGQVATHHNLLNHTCEIQGDTAHTETYYLFVGRNRDDSNWMAGGRYIDRLERREGSLAHRTADQCDRVVGHGAEHADSLRRRARYQRQRGTGAQQGGSLVSAAPDQSTGSRTIRPMPL